jgi:hypothetical protein
MKEKKLMKSRKKIVFFFDIFHTFKYFLKELTEPKIPIPIPVSTNNERSKDDMVALSTIYFEKNIVPDNIE